ncbi:MAG: hypothetical protein VXW78_04870, partial [Pseudomonadota bacterium]|nr:hypothetical protein [Pseudomonadota bacterium]
KRRQNETSARNTGRGTLIRCFAKNTVKLTNISANFILLAPKIIKTLVVTKGARSLLQLVVQAAAVLLGQISRII